MGVDFGWCDTVLLEVAYYGTKKGDERRKRDS